MVYAKYFVRNGKKIGPYYYKTIKINGKTKTIYLGKKIPKQEKKSSKKSNYDYIKKLQKKIKLYKILENNLKKNVNLCNLKYKLGLITQDKYRFLMDSYLKERSLAEWESYYGDCRKTLEKKIEECKTKGLHLKKEAVEEEYTEKYFDTYKKRKTLLKIRGKRQEKS